MSPPGEIVPAFLAAWATRDPGRRLEELAAVCVDDVAYTDPMARARGVVAVSAHIAGVTVRFPNHTIVLTSGVDAHHDVARFGWTAYDPTGRAALHGSNMATFADDGRLSTVVAFFGPLPQRTYTFGSASAR